MRGLITTLGGLFGLRGMRRVSGALTCKTTWRGKLCGGKKVNGVQQYLIEEWLGCDRGVSDLGRPSGVTARKETGVCSGAWVLFIYA